MQDAWTRISGTTWKPGSHADSCEALEKFLDTGCVLL